MNNSMDFTNANRAPKRALPPTPGRPSKQAIMAENQRVLDQYQANPSSVNIETMAKLLSQSNEYIRTTGDCEEFERERAMVFTGVKEQEGSSLRDLKKNDLEAVESLLDELKVYAVVDRVFRMGPRPTAENPRPRLLKVIVSSRQQQQATLKAVRAQRDVMTARKVRIRPSLTAEQRARNLAMHKTIDALLSQGWKKLCVYADMIAQKQEKGKPELLDAAEVSTLFSNFLSPAFKHLSYVSPPNSNF
jgi:hypothetical protein